MKPVPHTLIAAGVAAACAGGGLLTTAHASSHREAPFISQFPDVDGTDFYMFRSYEDGRSDFVTILANYQPLQEPWGGPSYYALDPNAVYEIHIDNNGDAVEDITFQFRVEKQYRNLGVNVEGAPDNPVPIPTLNIGPINEVADPNLNRLEPYTVRVVRDGRRSGNRQRIVNANDGSESFFKPMDYIGQKSFADYQNYAQAHIFDINIPGCEGQGRVFVGQRREGFYINLGENFDLLNFTEGGGPPATFAGFARDAAQNVTDNANITSIALEAPIACLTAGQDQPIIGGWTTASLPQTRVLDPTPRGQGDDGDQGRGGNGNGARTNSRVPNPNDLAGLRGSRQNGPLTQLSRLGHPLVNEVVIGLPEKNLFNASEPRNDVQNFGNFVLYPTLPVLVDTLFGVGVPPTPRTDLVNVFVTGLQVQVDGQPFDFTHPPQVSLEAPFEGGGEILRLNTAIPPTSDPQVGNLGVLGCDLAGFPNGRRPVDDVVDISLTAVEGALLPNDEGLGGPLELQYCNVDSDPDTDGPQPQVVNQGRAITDGTTGSGELFINRFPYLATPLPGSPNEADGQAPDSMGDDS